MRDQRGFALVITLIITALLVALTVEFVNEVFVDTSARQSFSDGQQASLLADSGVEATIKLRQLLQKSDYTSQTDMDQLAKLLHIEDEAGTIQVTVEDEGGKLNINAIVNPDGRTINDGYFSIAKRLFTKLGLSEDLIYAVVDWIDNDDQPKPAGAESPYYQTLKPSYVAKNGPLDSLEELRLVKGFDAKTIEKIRPYITVYYGNTLGSVLININTARKELIASLDDTITDDVAERIIDQRKEAPFTKSADLINVPGMAASIATSLWGTKINGLGSIYQIHSQSQVGETVRYIEAVVNSGGQILYWREY